MRWKTLLSLLVLACGVALAVYYYRFVSGEFEFRSRLLKVDPDQVTAFSVQQGGVELIFTLDELGWQVSNGFRDTYVPDTEMRRLINLMSGLSAENVEQGSASLYARYGLQEGQGLRVRIFCGREVAEDFLLGAVDSAEQKAYFRFSKSGEIFRVPASLAQDLARPYSHYRDMRFIQLPSLKRLDSVSYYLPGDSLAYVLVRDSGRWQVQGVALEEEKLAAWWKEIGRQRGEVFAEDFDEIAEAEWPTRRLVLWGEKSASASITCYERAGRALPFVFHTSQRKNDYYSSDSSGLFQAVFGALDSLLQHTLNQ